MIKHSSDLNKLQKVFKFRFDNILKPFSNFRFVLVDVVLSPVLKIQVYGHTKKRPGKKFSKKWQYWPTFKDKITNHISKIFKKGFRFLDDQMTGRWECYPKEDQRLAHNFEKPPHTHTWQRANLCFLKHTPENTSYCAVGLKYVVDLI